MSAQKIVTGIGMAALAALLVWVGLPAIRSPAHVPEVEIVVPVGDAEVTPSPPPPSREADDDSADDDDADDDGPDDADDDDGPDDDDDDGPDDDDDDD